jgi:putative ABC transport system substrate-binding protein
MLLARALLISTLALGLLAAPLRSHAQQPSRVPRIGLLLPGTAAPTAHLWEAFRQGLRERGYAEGQNIILERRYGEAKAERIAELAADLVRLKVDVIVTATTSAVQAVQKATRTIPIVMASSADPVGAKLVASLARPGGNITGFTAVSPELNGKRLELLKETVPGLSRVAVLWTPDLPGAALDFQETEIAARTLRLQIQSLEVRSPQEFDGAFAAMKRERANAVMLFPENPLLFIHRRPIVDLAAKHRLPMITGWREFPEVGALMSYGPDVADLFRKAATLVDKILKGAKPADLPVEQPTRFELVINLKTANALGLTIPPSFLIRADKVIE